ncbi:hypothetical protein HMPREF0083_05378 [Aneurinibacillus aneurinilyticus ATCC 12856]|uniref:Uncharacterized protein n=1 Tax=Aneurinibacillus aneurinilyticus ATCC 12856 TaxID=649747 RepID=U1Y5P3_ANEAE|nr:hypothetical protein HMPREF0083_05378 [Aneurinibacillus aneurinilyticus ATCC 12856]
MADVLKANQTKAYRLIRKMCNIFVVRSKRRRKSETRKRHIGLSSTGAQGASTLFFFRISSFQPRYPVKLSSVTYIIEPVQKVINIEPLCPGHRK